MAHVDVEKSKIPRFFLLRATVAMVTETKDRKWQSFKLVILIDMKKNHSYYKLSTIKCNNNYMVFFSKEKKNIGGQK